MNLFRHMLYETFIKLFFLFILLVSNNNKFKILISKYSELGINMFYGSSNISIIIETDSFDYQTFQDIWAPILSEIELKVQYVYFYVHKHNNFSPYIFNKQNNQTLKQIEDQKQELKKLSNLSFPRIVISDLPDNGYLPLMISSYTDDMYPLRVICYIDARNIDKSQKNYRKHIADLIYNRPSPLSKSLLTKWIEKSYLMHLNDLSVGSIFGFKTKVSINSEFLPKNFDSKHQNKPHNQIIEKVVGCDIVMAKETVIRELLYYTKSSMDSPSPFLTLSLINELKIHNSFENLLSNEFIEKVDFFPFSKKKEIERRPNEAFKCPDVYGDDKKNATFSIFVPCFRRNYFKLFFSMMRMQILQPSYYVLVQNRYHVYLDYESEFKKYFTSTSNRPVYKVWMLNYNSFFVLPNLITSLLNTDLVIRFDDDHIPTDSHILSHVVKWEFLESHIGDVIMGDRVSFLNINVGNFKNQENFEIDCQGCPPDYVASPYIYRPHQMKLSGRIKPMFLAGGEDAHFGLSASILCDTISKHISFNVRDFSDDENRHEIDDEIIQYKQRNLHYIGELIHNVYIYYVRIGLKPKCWKNFKLDPSDMINGSVYRHTPFF